MVLLDDSGKKVNAFRKRLLISGSLLILLVAGCSEFGYLRTQELVAAAAKNDIGEIRLMARFGANVNAVDADLGASPLYVAVYNDNYEAASLLIKLGAKARLTCPRGSPYGAARDQEMTDLLKNAVDMRSDQ